MPIRLTPPLLMIALLRQTGRPVAVYTHRTVAGTWCFRFSKNVILELTEAGDATWARSSVALRAELEPLIRTACETAVGHVDL